MADVRKILVIFLIGILYAVFVYSLVEAVYPTPQYDDYCGVDKPRQVYPGRPVEDCPQLEEMTCETGGFVEYSYDEKGCSMNPTCNYCSVGLDEAREKHGLIVFIISSVMALVAIAIGLLLPVANNNINEWIGTGFLLGGLITLFIGTARYYADMTRILRPIVMLIELMIVIYLAYKKLKK